MFIDARTLPHDTTIATDICIVGAGVAGLTLAHELAAQNIAVVLLESGGLEFEAPTQDLADGAIAPEPCLSQNLTTTRCRQFGGTANFWPVWLGDDHRGVRYVPLNDGDFSKREWLPHSDWPFDKAHLDPYYARAQALCQAGPYDYEPEAWSRADTPVLPLAESQMRTRMFQFGSGSVFTHERKEALRQSDTVTTYLHANVVEIDANPDASAVTRLRVATLNDTQFWVEADCYVLAGGGIENARLLLLSDSVQPEGLGNTHDVVGRYFMDHLLIRGGDFTPASPDVFNQAKLYDIRNTNDTWVMGHFVLSNAVREREQILNTCAMIYPRIDTYQQRTLASLRRTRAVEAYRGLRYSLTRGRSITGALSNAARMATGLDGVAKAAYQKYFGVEPTVDRGGWSNLKQNEQRFKVFEVVHMAEQAPDRDSRVVLHSERDPLGRRRAELHWRWSELDRHSIRRFQDLFAHALSQAGVGQFEPQRNDGVPLLESGIHHHMGTTRMHRDPTRGVVNEHGQVHGVANLFIAGSSVFPSGGYANPTLTIVALATRLAEHLVQRMDERTQTLVGATAEAMV